MIRSIALGAVALLSSTLPIVHASPAPHYPRSYPQQIPITGPVITTNFPDPTFIKDGDTYYAFATETINELPRLHVATSNDFVHWSVQEGRDGLAYLPSWANTTTYRNVWAPDVHKLDDGSFLMYFSALLKNAPGGPGIHCIGVARSQTAIGPYTPSDTPLVCPGNVGIIDASWFQDTSGQSYVVYKREETGTPLVIAPVSADGGSVTGAATTLLRNRGDADANDIEAPLIVKSGDYYILFFSPGIFTDSTYSVSYATSKNVLGPYTRVYPALVSTQSSGITGPGHMHVNTEGTLMIFHGLIDHATPVPDRGLWVTSIDINNGVVSIT